MIYCAICQRRMQAHQAHGSAYYRCRYAQEYALANQVEQNAERIWNFERVHQGLLNRKIEPKGFWGTLRFYLSGENRLVNIGIGEAEQHRQETMQQSEVLREATAKLAVAMRDERVEAFASLLWDGVYEYTYVTRATTPGAFVVPPARAEEMYSPEVFGRSSSDRVIVK